MITPIDALMMAMTKRRTRKVRTAFTIVASGLLFSFLFAVLFVTAGVFTSFERLLDETMSGRYIIQAFEPFRGINDNEAVDPELIQKATDQHKQLVEDKKREAKRLGIEYDPSSDPVPYETDPMTGGKRLSYTNAISIKLMAEYRQAKAEHRTVKDLERIAAPYNAKQYYTVKTIAPTNGALAEMVDGKEKLDAASQPNQGLYGNMPDYQEAVMAPDQLISNYIASDNKWQAGSGHIPAIVSQKRASQLAKIEIPDKKSSAETRLKYAQKLRKQAIGKTFEVCYRNQTSQDQINTAIQTAKEIAAHKNDKNYKKPSLIYSTPDPSSCGPVIVSSDTRTADEKKLADKQREFDTIFGLYTEPRQQKITYEVIGIAPNGWADGGMMTSSGVDDLIAMMLMTQTFRFAIPQDMYSQVATHEQYDDIFNSGGDAKSLRFDMNANNMYAEFDNADKARKFIADQSCQYDFNGACLPRDKLFMLAPYGSNSLAIDQAKNILSTAVLWVLLGVMVIAAIIASLTIGRTIADGRRETAVFRAIGFKRFDISQIYTTYTMLLCFDIVLFSALVGLAIALAVQYFVWLDATVQARLVLGVYDSSQRVDFVGYSPQLWLVVGGIFVAGIVGMLFPLLRNIRRNPIRDMREE